MLVSRKFYWNTVMPVHACIVRGCLHPTAAVLSSCDRGHMAVSYGIVNISALRAIYIFSI